jgi:diadenosine tetraphosphate (Ap4A) HIT family hydrolase
VLSSSDDCPFCRIGPERIAFSWSHGHAIWDGFPVSPGHLLLIPHRHAATWDDLTVEEKVALTVAIDQAMAVVRARHTPNGFNVGFNLGTAAGQTVFHFHLHVIPRYSGDVVDPRGGVRHVIPSKANYLSASGASRARVSDIPHNRALISGDDDAFIHHLLPHIDESHSIDLVVSFILDSGIRLLQPRLQELLDRGGRLRVVTGDYLDVTDPSALRRLLDLDGNVQRWIFKSDLTSFHPKSWIFYFQGRGGLTMQVISTIKRRRQFSVTGSSFTPCRLHR